VDYEIQKIATSGKYNDSYTDIMTTWSITDILDAHDMLDMFEEASVLAEEAQKR
jgi:hypothetical protein